MIELIRAEWVVGFQGGFQGGDQVIHSPGEVAFEDGRILYVGTAFPGTPDRVHEMGSAILAPGFIDLDALADIDHALIDSWHGPETASGLDWSEDWARHRRRDIFDRDDVRFRHHYAFTQLIRNGITTAMPIGGEMHNLWCESYEEWADAKQSALELGLRMYMGPSYRAGVNAVAADGTRLIHWDEALGEAGLDDALRFALDHDEGPGGLIRTALLPARIETLTPDLMRRTARVSEEHGLKVRLHCLQGLRERDLLRERFGKSALDLLDETGLLNERLLIPHGVVFGLEGDHRPTDADLARLAGSGATVIHCALTSLRYGMVLEDINRYRRAGVRMAAGTDSFPPDMIRSLDIASHLPKVMAGVKTPATYREVYRAATLGGAEALGRDDLGRLAPGACADMIVVDLSGPRSGVPDDPIRTMLMNCTGADIRDVFIGGRHVLQDGAIPGLDTAAQKRRLRAYYARMKAAYSERDHLQRPEAQLFPPTYPRADG